MRKANIEQFFLSREIAVIGVSGSGKKFGATVYKELKQKGFQVHGVNPKGGEVDGDKLYASLNDIPQKPEGVIVVVPPKIAEDVVRQAGRLGVKNIWLQPGAESKPTIDFCQASGLNVIHGQCVLMHAPPVQSLHKVHRFFNKLFGKLPA